MNNRRQDGYLNLPLTLSNVIMIVFSIINVTLASQLPYAYL